MTTKLSLSYRQRDELTRLISKLEGLVEDKYSEERREFRSEPIDIDDVRNTLKLIEATLTIFELED